MEPVMNAGGESLVHFSVVIPTYNRPERLRACLAALQQMDYPRSCFEVVVVDDGSSTPLEEIVAGFAQTMRVQLLRQPNSGPATARNRGAEVATGAFLAFTDDDCAPAADWLRTFNRRFAQAPDQMLGGRTINQLSDNIYSTASQSLVDIVYSYYNSAPDSATFFASNNMAMSREHYLALGGFSTVFPLSAGEDRDLCDKWLHAGHKLCYVPDAVIHHSHKLSLPKFWRQHFGYGRGAVTYHQQRAV